MSQLPENLEPQQPDVDSKRQADSFTSENVVQGNQNRVVQGKDNKAVQGDNNTVIQGNNNLMFVIKELIFGQQTTAPVGNPARPKNERILLAAVKEEVTARLRQSLHNAVLINLDKESQPQQVKCPWDADIKSGSKRAVPLPNPTTILQVFDSEEIAGKLLILGAPGAGKTTTQLELAQALVKRAEVQPDYPIPVLLDISSWQDVSQSITDWSIAELKSKYGFSKTLINEWLQNRLLLLLLDGLDEVKPALQESCVLAINRLLQSEYRPQFLVVCSRSEEYNTYETKLQLNAAVCVQELSKSQIENYLTAAGLEKQWQDFQNNLILLELFKNPLLLSISVLAAQELSLESLHNLSSTEGMVESLLDAYMRTMLSRTIKNKVYEQREIPSSRQIRYWLTYLALQLNKNNSSEFLIERMQFSWIGIEESKKLQKLYTIFSMIFSILFLTSLHTGFLFKYVYLTLIFIPGLIIGIVLIPCFFSYPLLPSYIIKTVEKIEWRLDRSKLFFHKSLVSSFLLGSVFGLIGQFFGGLISTLNPTLSKSTNVIIHFTPCKMVETLDLSLRNTGECESLLINGRNVIESGGEIASLLTGLLLGLYVYFRTNNIDKDKCVIFLFCLIGWVLGYIGKAYGWFAPGILVVSITGLVQLIVSFTSAIKFKSDLESTSMIHPNDGIWKSLHYALNISGFFILFILLIEIISISAMHIKTIWDIANFIGFGLLDGLLYGSILFTIFGGSICIQHFVLRLILYRNGYIPWNYARFLDYCTERMLLQRVGGRYRFIHKLLQDHFAQMEFKRN